MYHIYGEKQFANDQTGTRENIKKFIIIFSISIIIFCVMDIVLSICMYTNFFHNKSKQMGDMGYMRGQKLPLQNNSCKIIFLSKHSSEKIVAKEEPALLCWPNSKTKQ
jgi:hypothetical protein